MWVFDGKPEEIRKFSKNLEQLVILLLMSKRVFMMRAIEDFFFFEMVDHERSGKRSIPKILEYRKSFSTAVYWIPEKRINHIL